MTNTFTTISNETKTELAVKMVIIDAIEKGHINPSELAEYMESEVFKNSVANYKSMMNA